MATRGDERMEMSVSFSHGRVAARHDRRVDISGNVNKNLCKYNEHLEYTPVEQAFEECFGNALNEYNNKQSRPCRKISNYYQKVVEEQQNARKNKKMNKAHPEYEYVGQIGNHETNPLLQEIDGKYHFGEHVEISKKIYREFLKQFKLKYPNLKVTGFDIHVDEPGAAPHFHLRFVPVAEGYKQGMAKQCSLSKALENLGYKRTNRTDMQVSRWRHDQMDLLAEIAKEHGIERVDMNNKRKHIENGLYQEVSRSVEEKLAAKQHQLELLDVEIADAEEIIEKRRNEVKTIREVDESKVRKLPFGHKVIMDSDLWERTKNNAAAAPGTELENADLRLQVNNLAWDYKQQEETMNAHIRQKERIIAERDRERRLRLMAEMQAADAERLIRYYQDNMGMDLWNDDGSKKSLLQITFESIVYITTGEMILTERQKEQLKEAEEYYAKLEEKTVQHKHDKSRSR